VEINYHAVEIRFRKSSLMLIKELPWCPLHSQAKTHTSTAHHQEHFPPSSPEQIPDHTVFVRFQRGRRKALVDLRDPLLLPGITSFCPDHPHTHPPLLLGFLIFSFLEQSFQSLLVPGFLISSF
jgi:hypothetical protein